MEKSLWYMKVTNKSRYKENLRDTEEAKDAEDMRETAYPGIDLALDDGEIL